MKKRTIDGMKISQENQEDKGKPLIEILRKKGDMGLAGKKTVMKYNGFTEKGRVWTIY